MASDYTIDSMIECIKINDLRFALAPQQTNLDKISYVRIDITHDDQTIGLSVQDEYNDAPSLNQLVMLQLVLQECEAYEDNLDFNQWCTEMGHDDSDSMIQAIYEEHKTNVPQLRKIFTYEVFPIPLWEMEMNSELGQELRNTKIK